MDAEKFLENLGSLVLHELRERMSSEKDEGYNAGFKKGFEAGQRAGYKKKIEDTAKFDSFVELAGLDGD